MAPPANAPTAPPTRAPVPRCPLPAISAPAPAPTAPPPSAPIAVRLYSVVPSGFVAHPAGKSSTEASNPPATFTTQRAFLSLPFILVTSRKRYFLLMVRVLPEVHLIISIPCRFCRVCVFLLRLNRLPGPDQRRGHGRAEQRHHDEKGPLGGDLDPFLQAHLPADEDQHQPEPHLEEPEGVHHRLQD